MRRGALLDLPSDLGGAGEREAAHVRMGHERVARLLAVAGDHVQHAGREHLAGELGEAQRRGRGVLGRLDDDRVAGDQRRDGLAGGEHQRMVEGNDPPDDAERLHQRVVHAPEVSGDRLAAQLERQAGEIAQLAGRLLRVAAHLANRAAVLDHIEQGELLRVLQDRLGPREHAPCPLKRVGVAPRLERGARGAHGVVDVLAAAPRNRADHLAGRGIDHLDRLAAARCAEFPAHEDRPRLHLGVCPHDFRLL